MRVTTPGDPPRAPRFDDRADIRAAEHASIIRPRGLILADDNSYQQELVRPGGRVA